MREPQDLPTHSANWEWRQRRPWPADLRFTSVKTERVIERALPPRPVRWQSGNSSAMCTDARFSEDVAGAKAD